MHLKVQALQTKSVPNTLKKMKILKRNYQEKAGKFNPATDVEEVVPALSVDLAAAMVTGKVQNVLDNSLYTKETDVHSVGSYIRDKVQALQAALNAKASIAAARERVSAKKAAAAAAAAAAASSPNGAVGA